MTPSVEAMRQREAAVEAFAAAWAAGEAPAIDAHLQGDGAARAALLLELALVDLEERHARGAACVEMYLRRFPELANADALLPLLAREWQLRGGAEPERLRAEYVARFPELEGPLRRLKAPEPRADTFAGAWPTLPPADAGGGAAGQPYAPGYAIEAELGRGGMGVVYRAVQIRARRVVALKMTLSRPGEAGLAERARFRAEAEAMARLAHPNIVPIYEVGEHNGAPYFSMEYCDGGGLDRKLAAGPLPPREAAALLQRLALAVRAAHEAGVVHRDLKPANVLLAEGGEPKVTDFGLAKKLDEPGLTQTGMVMGTPSYMAPEQARGEKGIGPAADVWALGAVLYECLTGRPPFLAATPYETITQVINHDPVAPRLLNAKVPRDLDTICLKCLTKEVSGRYASAGDLADDLGRWLGGEAIVARPTGAVVRAAKWARKRPAAAGLVAVTAAAVIIGVAATWLFVERLGDEVTRAETAERRATDERDEARRQAHRADTVAHALQLDGAARALRQGELGRAADLLAAAPPQFADTWEHRHVADYLRRRRPVRVLRGHTAPVSAVAVSGDAGTIVSASFDKAVRVWDARTGKLKHTLAGHTQWVTGVAISGDGTRIVSGSNDGTVRIWDAAAGTELFLLKGHRTWVLGVAISRDGRRVVSGGGSPLEGDEPGEVKVWDAVAGRPLRDLRGHQENVRGVALSADGSRVVSASQDRTLKVWDAESGRELRTLRGHTATVLCAAISADGRHIASGGFDNVVRLWDAQTGRELRALAGHTGYITSVAFAPTGERLASGGVDRSVRVWDVAGGQERLTVRGHAGTVSGVAFTPDGRHLLSGGEDRVVKLWNAEAGQEVMSLAAHRGGAARVALTADGRRLATSGYDDAVRLWDAATGRPLVTLTGSGEEALGLALRPDGRVVASCAGRTVRLSEAETGRVIRTLTGASGSINALAYSPDGKRLAAAWDSTVYVWDAESGRQLLALKGSHEPYALAVAFSPDGTRLATGGGDRAVRLWDAATGRELRVLTGHANFVRAVAYSGDGKRIVSGGRDRTVRVWDVETGGELLVLRGHTSEVNGVSFSPDGRRVASGGADQAVRLWDAETGQEKLTIRGHAGYVFAVAFAADGRLVTAGFDGKVKVWAAPAAAGDGGGEEPEAGLPTIPTPDGRPLLAWPDPRRP